MLSSDLFEAQGARFGLCDFPIVVCHIFVALMALMGKHRAICCSTLAQLLGASSSQS